MRVAQALFKAYRVGCHHALAAVHRGKAVAVVTEGVVDVFVVIGRKIHEKVV